MISIDNTMSANNLAVISEDRNVEYTELTQIINNTASNYFEKGIKPGNKVAILSENSLACVIAIYALWRINAVPVPLNTRLNEEELSYQFNFSESEFLLKSESYSNILSERKSFMLNVEFEESNIEYKNETNEEDVAVLLFTSGSSGKPKGVEITNSNLYESYLNIHSEYSFNYQDRFLASLPFYHIGGFSIITRSILSGGTLIIPKSLKHDSLVESIEKYNPTVISLVPTMLKRLIDEHVKPNENLRLAFIGGGPSDDNLVTNAIDLGWPFVKVYGSTETSSMISGISGSVLRDNPSCGGKTFSNVDIKIFNDSNEEVKPFNVGEIAVKSNSVAKGYLKDNELWNKKFNKEYFLTGDYGYLNNDGYLFVVSRRTDLIISGGENIDPSEIEKVLLGHPFINEVKVFPVADERWGEVPVA
ncbi:MAG: o-succinylbenzoate--CoA ligase, partial [Bacteroidota bacterium]